MSGCDPELRDGRQAFVVCPLVAESELLAARAATAEFERLRTGELRDFRVLLMHGQQRSADKLEVMARFAAGEADVLVATTVIEVGIDVPNATVMLVEDAERYGISQLHQLRGRIGRGEHASLCLLFGPKGSPRLKALAERSDGFELAEIDLELRGEGELIGVRQSGLAQFRVAELPRDRELQERARLRAEAIDADDPELGGPRARAAVGGAGAAVRRRSRRPDPGVTGSAERGVAAGAAIRGVDEAAARHDEPGRRLLSQRLQRRELVGRHRIGDTLSITPGFARPERDRHRQAAATTMG